MACGGCEKRREAAIQKATARAALRAEQRAQMQAAREISGAAAKSIQKPS